MGLELTEIHSLSLSKVSTTMSGLEDNLWDLDLSFYNVGPWEGGTPFVGLATKSCYPLSLLSGPEIFLHCCVLVKT